MTSGQIYDIWKRPGPPIVSISSLLRNSVILNNGSLPLVPRAASLFQMSYICRQVNITQ